MRAVEQIARDTIAQAGGTATGTEILAAVHAEGRRVGPVFVGGILDRMIRCGTLVIGGDRVTYSLPGPTRHATSAEAFLEALTIHTTWRLDGGRVHRLGGSPLTVNAAAQRFAELGWIRCHVDGHGGHYWTAEREAA